jgi:nucleotide-binding universal stress UspA family protein
VNAVFTSLLCPVDFSDDSQRALSIAIALARATGAHLTLVTVVDALLDAGAAAAGARATLEAQTQSELRTLLDRASDGQGPAHPPAVSIRVGHPATEILAQVAESNADLVVMGMRGIGGAQKLLLGSTSARVLERSVVPVLVVPPPDRR